MAWACVHLPAVMRAALAAGADINAKSRWWAGGFGLLHNAPPELAAYAIERGAVVDVHAAARLGLMDRLRELVLADPALVPLRWPGPSAGSGPWKRETAFFVRLLLYFFFGFGYNNWAEFGFSITEME